MGWSWVTNNGTTCFTESFFGITRTTCEPTWMLWAGIVLAIIMIPVYIWLTRYDPPSNF